MNGTGTAFAPGKPLTRAMFAQILYSHAGKPTGAPTASSGIPYRENGIWTP